MSLIDEIMASPTNFYGVTYDFTTPETCTACAPESACMYCPMIFTRRDLLMVPMPFGMTAPREIFDVVLMPLRPSWAMGGHRCGPNTGAAGVVDPPPESCSRPRGVACDPPIPEDRMIRALFVVNWRKIAHMDDVLVEGWHHRLDQEWRELVEEFAREGLVVRDDSAAECQVMHCPGGCGERLRPTGKGREILDRLRE